VHFAALGEGTSLGPGHLLGEKGWQRDAGMGEGRPGREGAGWVSGGEGWRWSDQPGRENGMADKR